MTRRILLIDDELDFLKIMKNKIGSWGYRAIPASSGKKAIEVFKRTKIDVIILDYLMPDIDGIELLRMIRTLDNKIPVIILTAYPREDIIKEGNRLKIAAFIPKLSPYADATENLKTALDMTFKK